jgi:hypothetical protein
MPESTSFSRSPIALELAEAEQLIALARSKNLLFTIGYSQRLNPKFDYVKRCLDDGTIGQLISALVSRHITRNLGKKIGGRVKLSPAARSAVATGVYNGRIYVAGGEWQDAVVQTAFRVFEAYDPVSNTWSVLPPMATPRHGVAGAVIGNRFYAVSGDVQSSGTGVAVSTPPATAFEFSNRSHQKGFRTTKWQMSAQ